MGHDDEQLELIPLHAHPSGFKETGDAELFYQERIKLLHRARNEFARKNYIGVKESCDKILMQQRDNTDAKYLLGQVAFQEKEYVKAAGYYESARKNDDILLSAAFKNDCDALHKALVTYIGECLNVVGSIPTTSVTSCNAQLAYLDDALISSAAAAKFGPASELAAKILGKRLDVVSARGRFAEQPLLESLRLQLTEMAAQLPASMESCDQAFLKLSRIHASIAKLKFSDKRPLETLYQTIKQDVHAILTKLQYASITQAVPLLLSMDVSSFNEEKLTSQNVIVQLWSSKAEQFTQHHAAMGNHHLISFDPSNEKLTEVLAYRIKLDQLASDMDAELTFRICKRGFEAIPRTSITIQKNFENLKQYERIKISLQSQANIDKHEGAHALLLKVEGCIAQLKINLLSNRLSDIKEQACRESLREYDFPEGAQMRILDTLNKGLNLDNATSENQNKVIYADDVIHAQQVQAVTGTLLNYYRHKKNLFCCPSNTLELTEDFENQAPGPIRRSLLNS